MELMTYKCPNCGAAITFDSKSQQFKCDSCDSIFEKDQLEGYNQVLNQQVEGTPVQDYSWQENESQQLEGVTAYTCKFCGAEIVADATTVATECPYCNNPIIVAPKLSGGNRPDLIIPFRLTKDDAIKALKKHYEGKFLLPKIFKDQNRIKEIKGVYIPFWLFDCQAQANVTYDATRTRSWKRGDTRYTETSFYKVWRSGSLSFEKIPVDGSSKMDDAYMDAIEPFNYSDIVDFNPAYLSGYMADRYDVDMKQSTKRATERIENSAADAFRSSVIGYDSVVADMKNVGIANGKVQYALMPVWMLNTKYKDKMYTFAVNGQTGKLVGELPVDQGKYRALVAGIAAGLAALGQIIVFLLW